MTDEELILFNEQIEGLACKIKEADSIKLWVKEVKHFSEVLKFTLEGDGNNLKKLENLMEKGLHLGVQVYEFPKLIEVKLKFI